MDVFELSFDLDIVMELAIVQIAERVGIPNSPRNTVQQQQQSAFATASDVGCCLTYNNIDRL